MENTKPSPLPGTSKKQRWYQQQQENHNLRMLQRGSIPARGRSTYNASRKHSWQSLVRKGITGDTVNSPPVDFHFGYLCHDDAITASSTHVTSTETRPNNVVSESINVRFHDDSDSDATVYDPPCIEAKHQSPHYDLAAKQNDPHPVQYNTDDTQYDPDLTQYDQDLTQYDPDVTQYDDDVTQFDQDATQYEEDATHHDMEAAPNDPVGDDTNFSAVRSTGDTICGLKNLDFGKFETSGRFVKRPRRPKIVQHLMAIKTRNNITSQAMVDISRLLLHVVQKEVPCLAQDLPLTKRSFETKSGVTQVGRMFSWKCNDPECRGRTWSSVKLGVQQKRVCVKGHDWKKSMEHIIHVSLRDIVALVLPASWDHISEDYTEALQRLKKRIGISGYTVSASDIFLTINTDGYAMTSTSNASGWPVLAWIHGTSMRLKKDANMLLLGFWKGEEKIVKPSKPPYKTLLEPVIAQVLSTQDDPIQWKKKDGTVVDTKVFILSALADSAARNAVMGIPSFHSYNGCPYCFYATNGKYLPFLENMAELRTHDDYVSGFRYEKEVKGKLEMFDQTSNSPLLKVPYFNMVEGFPIDPMHCLWIGVSKRIVRGFLESPNHQSPFYIKPAEQKRLNDDVTTISPPSRLASPNPITKLKKLRAHEWQALTLYYLPLLLQEYLPKEYFKHFLLYVEGISLLMHPKPSPCQIDCAEDALRQFCRGLKDLYPEEFSTFNAHLLLHLPEFVRLHGSLSQFTMSPFEHKNYKLKRCVTGTQYKAQQAVRGYMEDLIVRLRTLSSTTKMSQRALRNPLPSCKHLLPIALAKDLRDDVQYFSTIHGVSGYAFSGTEGRSVTKHDDSWAMLPDGNIVHIRFFIGIDSDSTVLMFGDLWPVKKCFFNIDHLHQPVGSQERVLMPVPAKLRQVIKVQTSGSTLFATFVNEMEGIAE